MKKKLLSGLLMGIFVSSVLLSGCENDKENNNPTPPAIGETGTFTDTRDNKEYNWVEIGNQVWMSENLSYTGNDIKNITDNYDWYDNSNGDAWSYYDNNESDGKTYGVLYQWAAAKTACPSGWHLPTEAEWVELQNYLEEKGYSYNGVIGSDKIAKSLAANSGWSHSDYIGAVGNSGFPKFMNATGFSALPSGYRANTGEFVKRTEEGYWWSATIDSNGNYGNRNLRFDSNKMWSFHDNKLYGFSVRCIRD